jgi:hypothetical protein
MSDAVDRIECVIREEITRQAQVANDVLLFDPISGMLDGPLDIHALAKALAASLGGLTADLRGVA